MWVVGSHREGGSLASLCTSGGGGGPPASHRVKALQPQVLLVLEAQLAVFLKLTQDLV